MAKFQGTMLNFQGVLLRITQGTLFLQVDVMLDLPGLPVKICGFVVFGLCCALRSTAGIDTCKTRRDCILELILSEQRLQIVPSWHTKIPPQNCMYSTKKT